MKKRKNKANLRHSPYRQCRFYSVLYIIYKSIAEFKYVIWKEEKHYIAHSLNVDVSSFGDTKRETFNNLREALELYFEDTSRS